jgi:transposase
MAYPGAMGLLLGLSHDVRDRTAPAAQAYLGMREARVESLTSMVNAFQKQVHTWPEQLHHTSRHASRPPSRDPSQPPRPRRPRSPRRRGGPPGHRGATRTLIPVEAGAARGAIKPAQCLHGQGPFSGDAPTPWRHQGIARPPRQPVVTEEQGQQLPCPLGGESTRAPWPAGVPRGTYGPRVQATVARYPGASRVSKRPTQQAMAEGCGVPMRVGTISQVAQATPAGVAAPVEEARTYGPKPAGAPRDETR